MAFLGIIKLGDNIVFYCNTHTPSTGAAVDADAVPSYRVYEDETTAPILTGDMALLDDANTVGFYSEQVAVSVGNGFEAGKSYSVRKAGVVGGVTGIEIDTFQVTGSDLDDVKVDTAAILADTGADGVIVASHTTAAKAEIEAEVDDALGGGTGTALSAIPWNAAWDAEVQSEVQDAIEANDLDHFIQVTAGSEEPTDGAYLDQIMHKDASQTFDATTDSLEAIRDKADAIATSVSITAQSAGTTAGTMSIVAHVTYSDTISSLTIPSTWTKIWLTVKNDEGDADSTSILQIVESNPGVAADGLLYLNGATTTAAYASLTVDQSAGTIAIVIADEATTSLSAANIGYDVKCLASTGATTRLTYGACNITLTETRALA